MEPNEDPDADWRLDVMAGSTCCVPLINGDVYNRQVHNQCKNCGRYYRVDIEDEERQHFSVLHVACPYCGTTMSGEVHKTAEAFSYIAAVSYTHLEDPPDERRMGKGFGGVALVYLPGGQGP